MTILFAIVGSAGFLTFLAAPTRPLRTVGFITAVFSTVGFWASIIGV